jgi:hypothetical protein
MLTRFGYEARTHTLLSDPWWRAANTMTVSWNQRFRRRHQPTGKSREASDQTWKAAVGRMKSQFAQASIAAQDDPWKKWARPKVTYWNSLSKRRSQV